VERSTNPYPYLWLAGSCWYCFAAAARLIPFDSNVPAQVLSYIGARRFTDARIRFRAIFCELLDRQPAATVT
jgi:hypothetical protein